MGPEHRARFVQSSPATDDVSCGNVTPSEVTNTKLDCLIICLQACLYFIKLKIIQKVYILSVISDNGEFTVLFHCGETRLSVIVKVMKVRSDTLLFLVPSANRFLVFRKN